MSPNRLQYRFDIEVPENRDGQISRMFFDGFVDMLRYDSARVERFSGSEIQLVTPRYPEERRWRSFGIVLKDIRDERMPR